MDLPHWAGVLPLRRVAGPPEPDRGVSAPTPDYMAYVAEKEPMATP
jgi:hypothetical protein